jgi:6-phospho-beta-glucosidase
VKLAVLGGGGFRTPTVYRALTGTGPGVPDVTEVALYDTDPDRLHVVASILRQLAARSPDTAPGITLAADLDDALTGADAVFLAIRVGGVGARVHDERVALDLGLIGQETTGPGGIAFGLRTVPVAVGIAERIAALAPGAMVIDFTNPAGMVTEAMRGVLGDRVVGICDTPSDLAHRVAVAAGVDPASAFVDYVGLNHLGWLRGLRVGGRDVLPDLLADDERLTTLEEAAVFGPEWLRATGTVPNEYLWYWYCTREAVRAVSTASRTRGEVLRQQQESFYASVAADPSDAALRWERTLAARSAGYMAEARSDAGHPEGAGAGSPDAASAPGPASGYAGVALAVLAAAGGGPPATLVLNVANRGTVTGLPEDAVVEVPTVVGRDGITPLPLTVQPDLHQLGLMASVKAVERLTIKASLAGSPELAERAFALHPLVDSLSSARALLTGYRAQIPEVDAVFGR